MKKSNFLLFLALIATTVLSAQSVLNGTVSGADGQPIPGANVVVQNTNNGTTTDFDGKFSISVSSGDVLSVSYLGFATQNIIISN